jgi:hypothetical protein
MDVDMDYSAISHPPGNAPEIKEMRFDTSDPSIPKPQIISSYDGGKHNLDLEKTISRLDNEASYRDLSTVIIIPALKDVPIRIVASWLNLMNPPNQRIVRLFAVGMEVGHAYSTTLEAVLSHPEISKSKYLLTLEHDNAPPPDGLVKLLARAEANPQYAAIGGLYFTKGFGGAAQIWGNPDQHPVNFIPQKPDTNGGLVPCNGTGMGFTLFRMDMFKNPRLRRPWFKTTASIQEGSFSQDLYFWHDAFAYGYKAAIDCSVKIGHYDKTNDMMW